MKRMSYLIAVMLSFTAFTSTSFGKTPDGWITDVEKAFEIAEKENKNVLIEFTGSDYCAPCKLMMKEVFSKKEFVEKASKDFVLVYLDFPKSDPELDKKNTPYYDKYKVEGFPMIILLDSEGKEFTRFFAYEYPETELFLGHLEKSVDYKDLD
jgi:thioredoxin-related protein